MAYIFTVMLIACVIALDSQSSTRAIILTAALAWIVLMLVIADLKQQREEEKNGDTGKGDEATVKGQKYGYIITMQRMKDDEEVYGEPEKMLVSTEYLRQILYNRYNRVTSANLVELNAPTETIQRYGFD